MAGSENSNQHPSTSVDRLGEWLNEILWYWTSESPIRIHSRDVAVDGDPEWHQDFARWMFSPISNDQKWREQYEPRVRMTRAMRKLREKYPREYEVLYRTAILQIPIATTTEWLNARAVKNNKPERYSSNDTRLILIVAADKVASWF